MRTPFKSIRTGLAVAALTALVSSAGAADRAAADPPLSREEYDRKIQELEDAIKDLRKDTRQIVVAEEEKSKLKPIAGWDKGFFLQSPDGNNKLSVGGYVHFDGRYFTNDTDAGTSSFLFRRARIDLKGKFLKYYEFKFMPDFAGGQVVIQDAYLNVNYWSFAKLQAGKYKTPFGIERLQSANAIVFVERALPNNLVPNRDLGFMLWGLPFYGAMEYQLGIFDGVADGASNNTDIGFSDDKTFAGRAFFLPFKDGPWGFARGFGVGVAGTYGRRKGSVSNTGTPVYRTDGQQTFFSYVNTPASGMTPAQIVFANGPQTRITPQGTYYWGPFGFLWEWVQSNNDLTLNGNTQSIQASSWQTQASWVVTGEDNSYRPILPFRNFDPWTFLDGAWGSLQVAARYSELHVEEDVYTLGFANPATAARTAKAWAVGANWVLNPMVRLMLDFSQTFFTGGARNGGNRHAEDVIESRVQFVF